MSTCYSYCVICGEELGSAHDIEVLEESVVSGVLCVTQAAHKECWFGDGGVTDWEKIFTQAEDRRDARMEPDWDSR